MAAYDCKLLEREEQPTLSIRTHASVQDLSKVLGASYGAIGQYLGTLGEFPAGAPFAAYYNMDMDNLDIEIGFPVSKPLPGEGDIKAGTLPAGKYATCTHMGPYDTIEPAYTALTQWIQEHAYEATGVAYEFYLSDPEETPPEELQTQILFPLKSE